MKKTIRNAVLIVLAMAIVASVSIFGTIAWLSDEDGAVNVMTLGNVYIDQNEYEYNANGELVEFTQGKPLLPVVDANNVIDKIVTVTNTGSTGAYVRTIFAFEKGTLGTDSKTFAETVSMDVNTTDWTWSDSFEAVIGNNTYVIMVATYNKVLTPGVETEPSLNKVWMNAVADNEEVVAVDGNGNKMYDILVFSQAVQSTGFTSASEALDRGFGIISGATLNNLPWDASFVDATRTEVATSEAFAEAVTANVPVIVVDLQGDVTYTISGGDAFPMGGESTQAVVINGNGYTVNFNHQSGDWNNVVTNGATLIINDAKITNSGKNDGPWNRHDISFACDVVLNNVVSDKALAFKAGATLDGVVVNDANTSDTYAIWIQPKGQTVTINNTVIDMLDCSDGRGIKIDEQYLSDPAKVTLNINNVKFLTEEKAAILVKSSVGAVINASGLDIFGVEADPYNAVWVDSDMADCADLVTVNGARVIVEGEGADVFKATTAAEATNAFTQATNGDVIVLGDGAFVVPNSAQGKTLTVVGNGNTVIATNTSGSYEGCNYAFDGSNVTFENVIITTDGAVYTGYARCTAVYNNCVINNTYTLYGDSTFNNCTFNVSGDAYNVWTWGANTATFNDCTFNSSGKSILFYGAASINLSVNNCVFNDDNAFADVNEKAAIETGNDYGNRKNLVVNNVTVNGFDVNPKGTYTGTTIYGDKNSVSGTLMTVTIDGVDVTGKVVLATATDLVAFANKVNVEKNKFAGQTVYLIADVDLAGIDWQPVGQTGKTQFTGTFEGNGHVISNMTVNNTDTSKYCSSGLFGWLNGTVKNVVIDNASVTGHHLVGGIAGYVESATVENCVVKNSTFSCVSANEDANGDKSGAVVGQIGAPQGTVVNCSAVDCTVSAGRDAGQVVGAAVGALAANVTGCTATDVTVTANGTSTGANINNTVIGRK